MRTQLVTIIHKLKRMIKILESSLDLKSSERSWILIHFIKLSILKGKLKY